MEAVPASGGARRTVRLAAGLVAGQIVLVAVVGWVTLDRAGEHPAPVPGAGRLAAPRALIPPVPPSPGAEPALTRDSPAPADPDTRSPRDTRSPNETRSPRETPEPGGVPARPPVSETRGGPAPAPSATSSAPLTLVPPPVAPAGTLSPSPGPSAGPSAGPGVTPGTVVVGGRCDRIYAVTRADDGRMVICLPARDGQLRWKIV